MIYNKIVEAEFIDRPNRFLANVYIDGEKELVHVKNTGRCRELLVPGAKLLLEDCSHIRTRKTKYSVIGVWKDGLLINMDSQVPNTVVYDALNDDKIKGLKRLSHIEREVTYQNSRFDIYFENGREKGFMEVKGVTLEHDGLSMFPDAPTARGDKHVNEMIDAVNEGYQGYIFFLIQMRGPKKFYLNWETDPNFSQSIVRAQEHGVQILAYDSIVTEDSIEIGKPLKIDLEDYR